MDNLKIYLHDLAVRSEISLRQRLLRSGMSQALRIRFVTRVSQADICVLEQGSIFLSQANILMKQGKVRLWIHADGSLQDVSREDCMQCQQLLKSLAQSTVSNTAQKHAHGDFAGLSQGMIKGKGSAYVIIDKAILFFNFAHKTVAYNRQAKELLNSQSVLGKVKITHVLTVQTQLNYSDSTSSVLWRLAACLAQQNRLLEPLTPHSVIQLRSWPDFEQQATFVDYRMASLWQKRALSIAYVEKLLKVERKALYHFCNAMYLSGLLIIDNTKTAEQPAALSIRKSHALSDLWQKMRQVIGA